MSAYVLWTILASAAVTVIPRVVPLLFLSRVTFPPWMLRWLAYIPIAVLAALLGRQLFVVDDTLALPPDNLAPMAAVPALAVAVTTRSLVGAVAAGIVAMALLRLIVS